MNLLSSSPPVLIYGFLQEHEAAREPSTLLVWPFAEITDPVGPPCAATLDDTSSRRTTQHNLAIYAHWAGILTFHPRPADHGKPAWPRSFIVS